MKVNYIDIIRKRLEVASDEFIELYQAFRLRPLTLKDFECKEVYEFMESCKLEYIK